MKVRWTSHAVRQLHQIHDHIAHDSARYALRVVDRLTCRSQQIGRFPEAGRVVPEYESSEIREVIDRPYRIVYRILPDRVDVLSVIHGSRELRLPGE